MKIIKEGKIHQPEPKRCTCSKCGTIFEFETSEMLGSAVKCPLCHDLIQAENPYKEKRYFPPYIDERWRQIPRDRKYGPQPDIRYEVKC